MARGFTQISEGSPLSFLPCEKLFEVVVWHAEKYCFKEAVMANIVVGQSGGPTAVINSSLAGVYVRARELGAEKVYGMRNGIQGFLKEQLVDMDEYLRSEEDIRALKTTPAAFLGSCRYKLPDPEKDPQIFEKIFGLLEKYDIKAFVYIGGNDSMDTIRKLSDYAASVRSDICFVGAPKTVDNDLAETDHTPGYGSAAKYIAATIREVYRDEVVYAGKKTVYIMEIMGRNAGWLTAAAALARDEGCPAPDLIYLPETDFDLESFRIRVEEKLEEKDCLLVAVSEGIHLKDGTYVCEIGAGERGTDAFGHKQMGGTAQVLAAYCEQKFGAKTRALELNVMQRCGAHIASATDVREAFASGGKAAEAALGGQSGLMATLVRTLDTPYACSVALADVHQISNVEKKVPAEWITEEGSNVSAEFVHYAWPLILGESYPVMEAGLPRHMVLKDE